MGRKLILGNKFFIYHVKEKDQPKREAFMSLGYVSLDHFVPNPDCDQILTFIIREIASLTFSDRDKEKSSLPLEHLYILSL